MPRRAVRRGAGLPLEFFESHSSDIVMKTMLTTLLGAAAVAVAPVRADSSAAAVGINRFSLDLHRRLAAGGGNLVTSPWSIESALAMTYAGAGGETKREMAKVLHFTGSDDAVHEGFAALAADLAKLQQDSRGQVEEAKARGGPTTPLELHAANRLFGQQGFPFQQPFLDRVRKTYGAPLEPMDFVHAAEKQRGRINAWVEEQTRGRIKELIPGGVLDADTRLVLTNAVYLKAAWADAFREVPDFEFHAGGKSPAKVTGLARTGAYGHAVISGGSVVTVPYAGGGLQFVLLVPDERDGLAELEKQLTPEVLAAAAKAAPREVALQFPKFKLEPERVMLAEELVAMGMPTAFDRPQGSADFSVMAPRTPDESLFISHVIHQAFIAVDKDGTEAAAATAVVMARALAMPVKPPQPIEVRVDRPFAFAIQHVASGACLFLGRVSDPR
jgi:serpin B